VPLRDGEGKRKSRCERTGERERKEGRRVKEKVEGMGGWGRGEREVKKESNALQFCQLESYDCAKVQ